MPIQIDADDHPPVMRLLEFLTPVFHASSEQAYAMGRWLLATLVAVNGGALITFLGSDKVDADAMRWCAPAWLLGLMLALMSGLLSYHAGIRGMKVLSNLVTDLQHSLISGVLEDQDYGAIAADLDRRSKRALIAGYFSMLAFLTGAVAAAWDLILV